MKNLLPHIKNEDQSMFTVDQILDDWMDSNFLKVVFKRKEKLTKIERLKNREKIYS